MVEVCGSGQRSTESGGLGPRLVSGLCPDLSFFPQLGHPTGASRLPLQSQPGSPIRGAEPPSTRLHHPQHLPRWPGPGPAGRERGWRGRAERAPRFAHAGTRGGTPARRAAAPHHQPLHQADLQADPPVSSAGRQAGRGGRAACPLLCSASCALTSPPSPFPFLPPPALLRPLPLSPPPRTAGSPSIPLNGRILTAASRAPLCPRDPRSVSPAHTPRSACLRLWRCARASGRGSACEWGAGPGCGVRVSIYPFNKQQRPEAWT